MNRQTIITYCDVDLIVIYEYYPPSKGARERGSGIPLEPDEPATFELQDVFIGGQSILELISVEQIDHLESKLYEMQLDHE